MSNSELDPAANDRSLEPYQLTSLASMRERDMMELVWEDGRIASRLISSNTHIARDGFKTNKTRNDKINAQIPIPNFHLGGRPDVLNVLKLQDSGTSDNNKKINLNNFSHFLKPVPPPISLQNCAGATANNDAELIRTAPMETIPEPVVTSSSICSHGASNDPTYHQKRKYEDDIDDQCLYLSETSEEDYEDCVKAVPSQVNTNDGKKRRNTEMHNLSERKRRDNINKKLRVLRELIPNCNKVDKASMLDEAIEYLKTLQIQAQIMSMGCMPPMMLPTGLQQMYAPAHFSLGSGMGMRMDQLQFHTQSGATSLSGIPGVGYHQLLGMSMSLPHPNFLPSTPFAQSFPLGSVSESSSSMVEHPTSCSEY